MRLFDRLRAVAISLRKEVAVYQLVFRDPRTPKPAKWLIGVALIYALSPIDLIPDFVPVLGQIDDLILVPALLVLALKLVPQEVIDDCRTHVHEVP
jgi:uncharacterized membrane protein YkvA (DUF1232 family)